ncbi:uncharacterized protein LOC128219612 [Mya arenaria]|uniref:uncharacterized protein LOC128219612 n=1 Tax=Mya arenaria TaxID=6604 RepID=UPI0022E3C2F0|nr:uncharacterized protein LOC128219612 [Mya arenaria]
MDRKNIFLSLCAVIFTFGEVWSLEKPKGIEDDVYCLGCQVTVKEIDRMLRKKPTRGIGETVTRALAQVCEKQVLDKYELKASKSVEICKHITKDEGLEAALIGEYGRLHAQGKQTSYMEMASLICGKIIKACAPMRPIENMKDEDGSITYDPETEGFKINPGKKVRVAGSSSSNDSKKEPVKQSKPDSIPVRQAHNHEEL